MKIEVKGHSGCHIDVVREDDGQLYVYKSTYESNYTERLTKQAEKQSKAAMPKLQNIRVPKVYKIEQNKGGVSVKMDYVYSKNFVQFFEHAGFEQIDYLIDALKMYIDREVEESLLSTVEKSIIYDKFEDVVKRISENSSLINDTEITNLLIQCRDIFAQLEELILPVGICHGDLTFSNILFNGNNYYLIDFLDSFIESPLIDIVKIRQDTAWLWSQLMYAKPYDEIRLKIAFSKIDRSLNEYFSKRYDWYNKYYGIMQLMNFLRILQYAHDKRIIEYLKQVINEQLEAI